MFILIRLTQNISGIIMPIIRRTDYVNNCVWSMPGCVGCSRAELGHELCALCESWYTNCSLQTGHITLSSTPYRQLESQSTKYERQRPSV